MSQRFDQLFDNISRSLAAPMARRQTLRLIGGALAGGAVGLLHKRVAAQGICPPGLSSCGFYGECCGGGTWEWQCCPHPSGSAYNYCAPAVNTCCAGPNSGGDRRSCSPGSPCCIDASGRADCYPPEYTCCGAFVCDGTSICDKQTNGCVPCPENKVKCGNTCCELNQRCIPETTICVTTCPASQVECGKVCCPSGQFCSDPETSTCTKALTDPVKCSLTEQCPIGQLCDLKTNICVSECPSGQDECGNICCPEGQSCDPKTNTCKPPTNPPTDKEKAERIKAIAKQAAKDHQQNCSGSVRQVAKELGIPFTEGNANTQIDWMEKNWQKITMAQAKERADRGELVVAGRKDTPNGHTTIVVEGKGDPRKDGVWPNIAGGAKNDSWAKGMAPSAYSEGDKTIRNAWGLTKLSKVKYYTPK